MSILQWLREGQHLDAHDLSSGLRENWSARRRWKMAISGVQAAVRLSRGVSVSSSLSNATATTSAVRTSGEYATASEDEHDTDTEPSTAEQSPRPFVRHAGTTDAEAKELAQKTQKDLDHDMQKVLAKAEELRVHH